MGADLAQQLQQSSAPTWKYHMDAAVGLVSRAGGMRAICRSVPVMTASLTLFVMYGLSGPASASSTVTPWMLLGLLTFAHRIHVTGSSTSPASTFTLNENELGDLLGFIEEYWEDRPYPSFMCPTDILLILTQINHLRSQLLKSPVSHTRISPEELVAKLKDISPETWAASKSSSHEQWLLIASVYHSAAILYCISTLEPHFSPSSQQGLETLRAIHASRLLSHLEQGKPLPAVRRACLWPLIVAGVEVARDNLAVQSIVRRMFDSFAEDLATPLMLEAKIVLGRFWTSGNQRWDDCFDRPYAFIF